MKTLYLILITILLLSFWRCEKDSTILSLCEFEQNEYYDSEIFDKEYLDIYGRWELFLTIGGFVGQQEIPPGKFLQVVKYGVYEFLEGNSITSCGRIVISEQDSEDLKIKFEDYGDASLVVSFESSDTLILLNPLISTGFSSHYKRVE